MAQTLLQGAGSEPARFVPVPLSKIGTRLLPSLANIEENRKSLACIVTRMEATSHWRVMGCIKYRVAHGLTHHVRNHVEGHVASHRHGIHMDTMGACISRVEA